MRKLIFSIVLIATGLAGCGSSDLVALESSSSGPTGVSVISRPGPTGTATPVAPEPTPTPGPTRPSTNGITLVNADENLAAFGRADDLHALRSIMSKNGRYLYVVVNELSAISEQTPDPVFPRFEGYLVKFDLLNGTKSAFALNEPGGLRSGSFLFKYFNSLDVTEDGRYLLLSALDSRKVEGDALNTEETDAPAYLLDTENGSVTPINYDTAGAKFAVRDAAVFLGGKDRVLFLDFSAMTLRDFANNEMRTLPAADFSLGQGRNSVSRDGSRFVFSSKKNLTNAPDPGNSEADLPYLYDVATGNFTLLAAHPDGSLPLNGFTEFSISADGKLVAYLIDQADLDPERMGTKLGGNLYLHNVETGVTKLLASKVFPNELSYDPVAISPDGTQVAYVQDWRHTRGLRDKIILHEVATGDETVLSDLVDDPHLTTSNYTENQADFSFSADSKSLSFLWRRSGQNSYRSAYVYNLETGALRDIFKDFDIFRSSDIRAFAGSADASAIVFSTNEILVGEDRALSRLYDLTFGQYQTYFVDLVSNTLAEISVRADGTRHTRGRYDHVPDLVAADISDDGQTSVFTSNYSLGYPDPLEGTFGLSQHSPTDVFLKRRGEVGTYFVSTGLAGLEEIDGLAISGDGSKVAFSTYLGLYLYDVANETRALVLPSNPANSDETITLSDLDLNVDGSVVSFVRARYERVSFQDILRRKDVCRLDVARSTMVNLTQGAVLNSGVGGYTSVSADGRFVTFDSSSALIAADTNSVVDIYRYDHRTGGFELVSLLPNSTSSAQNALYPSMSASGRFVSFSSVDPSYAAGTPTGTRNIFVKDMEDGRLALISRGGGSSSNDFSSLSADGTRILFRSFGEGLVVGANPYSSNLFVTDNPLSER